MNKITIFSILALVSGIAIGLALNDLRHSGSSHTATAADANPDIRVMTSMTSTSNPSLEAPAQSTPSVTTADNPDAPVEFEQDVQPDNPDAAIGAGDFRSSRITARLLEEQAARQRLENDLQTLKAQVQRLDRSLATLARGAEGREPFPQTVAATGSAVDTTTLMATGLDQTQAEIIAQRWSDQQMDMLYLRDQAIREGWIDTPRYDEEVRTLRRSAPSLRDELGEEGYDRFLQITGRPNRVAVASVFENSPGHMAGLQAGDVIVSYDDISIRSGTDLREATVEGTPDEPVTLRVLRDGNPVELTLPRGPIGVQMNAVSVPPN